MCNCVYVCVVNALCLQDCIQCSLIREGSGTRGLKILQSFRYFCVSCPQCHISALLLVYDFNEVR